MVICKAYGVNHDLATASRVEDLARSANGYREGPRKAKAIPSRKAVPKKVSDVPPGKVLDRLQLSVKPPRPPGQGGFPLFFFCVGKKQGNLGAGRAGATVWDPEQDLWPMSDSWPGRIVRDTSMYGGINVRPICLSPRQWRKVWHDSCSI